MSKAKPLSWESFIHLLALDLALGTVTLMVGKGLRPPSFSPREFCLPSPRPSIKRSIRGPQ